MTSASGFQPSPQAMRRLHEQVQRQMANHLTDVANKVYETHAGRPVEEVLAALLSAAKMPGYTPDPAGLRPAAEAISRGERFSYR